MKKLIFLIMLVLAYSNSSSYIKDSLMLEMNDGIRLHTIIYKPTQQTAPLPAILIRTINGTDYFEQQVLEEFFINIVDLQNYILVLQDFRGRHKSEGAESFYRTEKQDGHETIEWIAMQEWCDGKVAMWGYSALATAQYLAAASNPPHFVCGFPVFGAWNGYKDIAYRGGEFRKEVELWLKENEVDSEVLDLIKQNSNYNQSWDYFNLTSQVNDINVPFFHTTGWYDGFLPSALDAYYQTQFNGDRKSVV